jgi:hypothetical protein
MKNLNTNSFFKNNNDGHFKNKEKRKIEKIYLNEQERDNLYSLMGLVGEYSNYSRNRSASIYSVEYLFGTYLFLFILKKKQSINMKIKQSVLILQKIIS